MIWGDRIKALFRMRAESIPQGYGIYSARMRNMRLIQGKIVEGIPEKVDTLCDLDRGCPTPRSGSQGYFASHCTQVEALRASTCAYLARTSAEVLKKAPARVPFS